VKYEVLDDIAFERVAPDDGNAVLGALPNRHATATAGDVVELTEKDASALLKRGAVKALPEEVVKVTVLSPKQLEE
jgi:hypothetical protein